MPDQRARLREDAQFRILCALRNDPKLTQRELASALGISTGALHYLLKALIDKGLVKLGNFSAAPVRRRYAYLLTPKGIAEKSRLTHSFLRRKMTEYRALQAEIAVLSTEINADVTLGLRERPRCTFC